jgi:hypothetical protein
MPSLTPRSAITRSAASVVPPLEVTRSRRIDGRLARLGSQRGGALHRFDGQLAALLGRKAELGGGLLQRFDEQEDVGRAAARNGGDAVDLRFVLDPDGAADGAQDAVGSGTLVSAHFRQGAQAGDAGADQRRRVGHAADESGDDHPASVTAPPGRGRRRC